MAAPASQPDPARDIERRLAELDKGTPSDADREEIERLRGQLEVLRRLPGEKRTGDAWEQVLLARHPNRPYTLDYIHALFTEFTELHGDRRFADDAALVGGLARFEGRPVMVVGHQKGRDTEQRVQRNFGMPNPEGYRKALRLMQLAEKFRLPIISLIDTPAAYPGKGAEERGQAEAIAHNLKEIPKLRVPIVVAVHGEGGSGGALAIAIGDRVMMFENAIYSVIPPESCSSILWRDWEHKQQAARALKLTARDLQGFGIVDEIVEEPPGGAHTDPPGAAARLGSAISSALRELTALSESDLLRRRHDRLRKLATFVVEE
ncbi:MAG TPA: acetyl-CoA carboxylase carboxyltransferase subunit alpha [Terriglobia bacterium]|nr:acetyl-CoA carboxylase carboxyltransferase subunit alpha [Terriglobia bacterium]